MILKGEFIFVENASKKESKNKPGSFYNMVTLSQDYRSTFVFYDDELIPVVEKIKKGQPVSAELDIYLGRGFSSCKLQDLKVL